MGRRCQPTTDMPHLDDNTLKVMEVLERHRALDVLQIASRAELSVSAASRALEELTEHQLLTENDGVFSLNSRALSQLLELA